MCLERPRTNRNKESIRRADRDSIKYTQKAISYVSQADAVSHHCCWKSRTMDECTFYIIDNFLVPARAFEQRFSVCLIQFSKHILPQWSNETKYYSFIDC